MDFAVPTTLSYCLMKRLLREKIGEISSFSSFSSLM
jgi:hypothetical protein